MTEQEFLKYMQKAWEKGRQCQVSGSVDSAGLGRQEAGRYMRGHALLPKDYDMLFERDQEKLAALLFQKEVANTTKEVILMILAHQSSRAALFTLKKYCLAPDKGLESFARIALDECEMWNE